VPHTFCRFASTEVLLCSVMSLHRRHHEDRAGTPGIYCQPHRG
jgi:hypothetical protein